MKMEFQLPDLPTFNSVEEERQEVKKKLAASFRLFSKFGFSEGLAGHITARDPENKNTFWVNPFGVHFSQICVSNLTLIDENGNVLEGEPCNAAAFAIHSSIHKKRTDIVAAAHAHALYGKTWSAHKKLLSPLTQDACAFFDDHSLYDEYNGVVYDTNEGDRIAKSLGNNKAVIMANHGNLTVGKTVDAAVWWFISMERTCQSQILANLSGRPISIDDKSASFTREQVGTEEGGWLSFQPLYQMITKEQPDLLD